MATILDFRTGNRSRLTVADPEARAGESADIVFFPGVRYERPENGDRSNAGRPYGGPDVPDHPKKS